MNNPKPTLKQGGRWIFRKSRRGQHAAERGRRKEEKPPPRRRASACGGLDMRRPLHKSRAAEAATASLPRSWCGPPHSPRRVAHRPRATIHLASAATPFCPRGQTRLVVRVQEGSSDGPKASFAILVPDALRGRPAVNPRSGCDGSKQSGAKW